jgi:hypothetical protein
VVNVIDEEDAEVNFEYELHGSASEEENFFFYVNNLKQKLPHDELGEYTHEVVLRMSQALMEGENILKWEYTRKSSRNLENFVSIHSIEMKGIDEGGADSCSHCKNAFILQDGQCTPCPKGYTSIDSSMFFHYLS